MRVEQALASVLVAATLMALVGCTLAPPPTAAQKATPTPAELPTHPASPTVAEDSPTAAAQEATPAPTELPVPTAVPEPTLAPASRASPSPRPTETGPTRTPKPTIPPFPTLTPIVPTTTPLPTSTPLPTLSPEAVAATEALVPEWVRNRSALISFLLSLKRTWPECIGIAREPPMGTGWHRQPDLRSSLLGGELCVWP